MDIGAVFLILAVIILCGLFISRPFTGSLPGHSPAPKKAGAVEEGHSGLQAEYERQLNALQELDFDHRLGKIPDEDYPRQRQALLVAAADLLRRLDAAPDNPLADEAASRVEHVAAAKVLSSADDDLEALIAARRRARHEKPGGFCPTCGKPVQESDVFCSKCGTHL